MRLVSSSFSPRIDKRGEVAPSCLIKAKEAFIKELNEIEGDRTEFVRRKTEEVEIAKEVISSRFSYHCLTRIDFLLNSMRRSADNGKSPSRIKDRRNSIA